MGSCHIHVTNYFPFFTFEIHERDQVYEFVSEWPQLSPGPLCHQREEGYCCERPWESDKSTAGGQAHSRQGASSLTNRHKRHQSPRLATGQVFGQKLGQRSRRGRETLNIPCISDGKGIGNLKEFHWFGR